MQDFQQRVVDEKAELDDKRDKLDVFIRTNPVFGKLPGAEAKRLVRQYRAMTAYSEILGERIAAFA